MNDVAVGALIGGGFALAGLVFGKLWDAASDNKRWNREGAMEASRYRREQRTLAYTDFLASVRMLQMARSLEDFRLDAGEIKQLMATTAKLDVFGSRDTYALAKKVSDHFGDIRHGLTPGETDELYEEFMEVLDPLIDQCRADLGISD
jgi:hypothetical protein